jgi:hypothetical protein
MLEQVHPSVTVFSLKPGDKFHAPWSGGWETLRSIKLWSNGRTCTLETDCIYPSVGHHPMTGEQVVCNPKDGHSHYHSAPQATVVQIFDSERLKVWLKDYHASRT